MPPEKKPRKRRTEYTDTEWGWDYDMVLDDETTRVRRLFVDWEAEIGIVLAEWLTDGSAFRPLSEFDSSLVNTMLDAFFYHVRERPHLWHTN